MRKLAFATAAAALAIGLGANAASAHDSHYRFDRDRDHRAERHGEVRRHGPAVEIVRASLHRRYRDETIPLRRLLGLGRDYAGYRIQSVTVDVRTPHEARYRFRYGELRRPQSGLVLLTDGNTADRAWASGRRRIELAPHGDRTLGRDFRTLQLAVKGPLFIDSIQVRLRPPRHHRRGRLISHLADKQQAQRPARIAKPAAQPHRQGQVIPPYRRVGSAEWQEWIEERIRQEVE